MNKMKNKKGFSLIELGIVIAVITMLIVGIASSAQLISFSKRMSVWRSISQAEKAIGSFNSLFSVQGMKLGMGTIQACDKLDDYFLGSTNDFCKAMYTASDDTLIVPTSPIRAFMTEQLVLTGYIPAGKASLKSSEKYLNPRKANTVTIDTITYTTGLAGNDSNSEIMLGDSKGRGGSQLLKSQVDNENFLAIGYTDSQSRYYGTPYTVLSNQNIGVNDSNEDNINAYKYIITVGSFDLNKATFTSSEMQLFDSKYDDGELGTGKIFGGRIESADSPSRKATANTAKIFTFDAINASSAATSGGMKNTEVAACFNFDKDSADSTPYIGMTEESPTKTFTRVDGYYTTSASRVYSKATTAGVAISASQKKRAKTDPSFGCNVVYLTSHKYNND